MYKSVVLLLVICAQIVLGAYTVVLRDSDGRQARLVVKDGSSQCFCLANSDVRALQAINAVNLRLYTGRDCTGSFRTARPNGIVNGASWVKSVSFGEGIRVPQPPPTCPNYFGYRPN
ncbi:hypothetical protein BGW42_003302 [Actinomortierella wolfii]|nr:hypothetical protein BGW42_003302 [Actinomortierella wolfii]